MTPFNYNENKADCDPLSTTDDLKNDNNLQSMVKKYHMFIQIIILHKEFCPAYADKFLHNH